MGIQVNVQNGEITPAGSELGPNVSFEWYNPGTVDVELKYCGNWCTPDSCKVLANGGTVAAQVLPVPNTNSCAFYSSGWNAPGQPHIVVNPWPTKAKEREVA